MILKAMKWKWMEAINDGTVTEGYEIEVNGSYK